MLTRLRLDEDDTKRLSFGLGFGAIQYRLDGTKFNATDDGDTNIPAGTQSSITPDFRLAFIITRLHICWRIGV
jgi:hypothetical protein